MPAQTEIKNDQIQILIWYLTEPEEWFIENVYLSDNEIVRLNSISNKMMRRRFLAVRYMKNQLGISEIKYLENGKPVLENGYISISHSGNWLALQFSETVSTGIDIEKIQNRILKIKDRFLTSDEINKVCNEDSEKMILCWSAKESVFKKYGGETVYFKDNMAINKIDSLNKVIEMNVYHNKIWLPEKLNYFMADSDYVVVHTL